MSEIFLSEIFLSGFFFTKEYMMMMGLSRNSLWTSYFVYFYCLFLVSVSILTIVLCGSFTVNGALVSYSHWSVIWVFLLLYGVSLITMGFMVSTWCDTSSATAAGTTVFVFVMYLPFSFIQNDIEGIPHS